MHEEAQRRKDEDDAAGCVRADGENGAPISSMEACADSFDTMLNDEVAPHVLMWRDEEPDDEEIRRSRKRVGV